MHIAIIGAGNVGGTLGRRWAQQGHYITYGARDATSASVVEALAETPNAQVAPIADAVRATEIVVFATPWHATRDAVEAAGELGGKLVLDATNPLRKDLSGFDLGQTLSGGEQVALWARGASVVKIFNTTGFNVMRDPHFGDEAATMFYCGDDIPAKQIAHRLALDLGFDPVDAGPLLRARLLEPLALLWISLAISGLGREIAFKLLRR